MNVRQMTDYFIFDGFYAVVYNDCQDRTVIVFVTGSIEDAVRECAVNNAAGPLRCRVVPLRRTDRMTVY